MDKRELELLLKSVAVGNTSPEEAAKALCIEPFSDLGFAKVDHHRGIRQGVSEIIYGEGKTADQMAAIISNMIEAGQDRVLVTRLAPQVAKELEELLRDSLAQRAFDYHEIPRLATIGGAPSPDGKGIIAVCCGGTSDLYAAEEAAVTAEMLGNKVMRIYDVGVSGLHRLLSHHDELVSARVVVAVAGMEGALASVVGGLVSCPVIAVPTSVGYGASFEGLSALLAMLNSCASGVSVVNIDNGFGAGYQASLINHLS
jgi:hypothetical protein